MPIQAVVLLLLLLGNTLAIAPGDEYDGCGEQHYPSNIKVLLDSYRYHYLLPYHNGTITNSTVWVSDGVSLKHIPVLIYHCSGILRECVTTVQL